MPDFLRAPDGEKFRLPDAHIHQITFDIAFFVSDNTSNINIIGSFYLSALIQMCITEPRIYAGTIIF